ncbi:MAG: hypothetical protein FIB03_16985 [Anaerolineae bacterium]|nr:hypothetical protein [Anaerolineae bacterium]
MDNASLDAEFNNTLSALTMQGLDLNKVRGGRKGQQQLAQAVAMESANRVLTRNALDVLKSIAVGEYKSPEERAAEAEAAAEAAQAEAQPAEAEAETEPAAAEVEAPTAETEPKSEGEAESKSE